MPTGHDGAPALCRLEDRSRRGQPGSFLRCSGSPARRRFLHPLGTAQVPGPTPMLLPSIPALESPFVLSSLSCPHVATAEAPPSAFVGGSYEWCAPMTRTS